MKITRLSAAVLVTGLTLISLQTAAFADDMKNTTEASKVNKGASADANVLPNTMAVTDAQIAEIVKTANNGEIDAAKYAKSHSKNPQVKEFAMMMIKAHETNNKQANALAKKLDITPTDSDASKNLKMSANMDLKNLKSKKGDDLDRAYAESQVTMHNTVLASLDNTLIPSAQNADLKAMLQKTRGDVAMHLEHAKALQESVNSHKM
jgi:putative membrane protein